jgi:Aminotransferase class I and II
MGQHPKVIEAMCAAARRMGAGAGGTRNISGTNRALVRLEAELADLHGKEAALVFTSGYVSNHTGIATIARLLPDCLILSDALNHNSMIEGVRAAGCARQIWRHNDLHHLEELLARAAAGRPKLIVFESVYSMDGDAAKRASAAATDVQPFIEFFIFLLLLGIERRHLLLLSLFRRRLRSKLLGPRLQMPDWRGAVYRVAAACYGGRITGNIAQNQSATENRHHGKDFSHGITPPTLSASPVPTMSGYRTTVVYPFSRI